MATPTRKGNKDKKTFVEQFAALKHIPPLFRMIWQTNKRLMMTSIVLRLIRAIIPTLNLYIAKLIIDEVVKITQDKTHDTEFLWQMVALEFVLVAINDLLMRSIRLTESLLGDLFSNRTSVMLIEQAARLDLYQFEDPTFYDKLERARTNTTGRTVLMSQVFEQCQQAVTLIFLTVALASFNAWLLLILMLAVLPSFISETYFSRWSYSLTLSWTPERRELDYLRYIGASDETAKEVKIFGLADFLANRFRRIADNYFRANRKIAIKKAAWGTVLALLETTAFYGSYVYIVLKTIQGELSIGTMTFLAGSFTRMQTSAEWILSYFNIISESALYLQDFFDFLKIKPLMSNPQHGKPVPKKIQEGFRFENVSFKYLNSEKYAVKNLSFELKAGEKLALVGENGAGKTTIVKLLARLYEPSEGRILLDGIDLRDYDQRQLKEAIGIIFQDFVRFNMQANENIAIGRIDRLEEQDRIEQSAQKSLADTVVEGLPEKYEQMLGKRFAKGVDLSGGQWQKIALARAYMRDSQLIILDEPTAALDARAEHEVFLRFSELTEGKSAVLISHRFSTVRMADRILFLEHGQLLEIGTHHELMAQNGKYAELFGLQARGYV